MNEFKKILRGTKVIKLCPRAALQAGLFGVEIEMEGQDLPINVPGWQVHKEGSLRGNACEYVTDGAVSRENLETALKWLAQAYKSNNTKIKRTYRAGIHIHYNMQEHSLDDVLHSIIRWTIIEPVFLKWMGAQRDGNLFCLPQYDCGDGTIWFENLLKKQHVDYFKRYIPHGKYSALNTDPIVKFGTLEGRCFPSEFDIEKICHWADLMHAVLKPGKMTPAQMFDKASINPEGFLEDVFGHLKVEYPRAAPSLIGFGLENVLGMLSVYEEFVGD